MANPRQACNPAGSGGCRRGRALAAAALLACGLAVVLGGATRPPEAEAAAGAPGDTLPPVLRVHVVANSDSPVDQDLKRAVWSRIAPRLQRLTAGAASVEDAEARLRPALPRLGRDIAALLEERGAPYGVRVELGVVTFGPRAFDQPALASWGLPAGRYRTLLVRLGRGEGHNWWCVLFPGLCFFEGAEAPPGGARAGMETGPAGPEGRPEARPSTGRPSTGGPPALPAGTPPAGDRPAPGITPAPGAPGPDPGPAWSELAGLLARFLGLEARAAPGGAGGGAGGAAGPASPASPPATEP